ncbi:DUF1176 domain-containing protein [Kaistia dalseonensis]|uniref:DUF1176 domain-containing protein n=1 Tax=Kaistia dalseonensis TaxID=410840 RepID=A0ABU0H9D1_9HYPH|nr:DUF1176 domain-containing protein [Kaistia dalseonensis]MCX5496303.1 DUF1176 domain-containing protein [Kaistia dalseonensis]MDQ0438921.1 hypothetical protein [Kaistia dalseonensis]
MRRLTASLLLLALTAPVPAKAEPALSKTVRDWTAYCDNLRNCSAFGYATTLDEELLGAWITIARDGAADAAPTVLIGMTLASDTAPTDANFELAFDDAKAAGLAEPIAASEGDAGAMTATIPAASVPSFLAALRKAGFLKATLKDATSTQTATISLSGATGALLWIDEAQERLGTVTALIRSGPKPASSVPPPPAMPIIQAAKPVEGAVPAAPSAPAQKKLLGEDCTGAVGDSPIDPIIGRLDAHRVLYGLFCDAGAYNYDYSFFVATDGGPLKPISLDVPAPIQDDASSGSLVNPDFDAKTLQLSSFAKGRGIGDCGSIGEWVWDGSVFRMLSYQALDDCNGVPSTYWPMLYRARIE